MYDCVAVWLRYIVVCCVVKEKCVNAFDVVIITELLYFCITVLWCVVKISVPYISLESLQRRLRMHVCTQARNSNRNNNNNNNNNADNV